MPPQKRNGNSVKSGRHLDEDLWLQGIDFLLGLNLPGMRVQCPRCARIGVPGPKWVRGPKIKPVYVFHKNGSDRPDCCPLDVREANQVRVQVNVMEQDVRTLLCSAKPYVLFSGGRDSLCMLDYVATVASSVGKEVTALHATTTVGFPEVSEYVSAVCRQLKVDLKVVQPAVDYFTLAKQWGIPGINSRWCCRELKIRPMMDFLATVSGPKIVFDGIRAVESSIRAKYLPVWFHPSFNCLAVSAIFHWSDEDVNSYVKKRNLPAEASSLLGTSGECWCGAYKTKDDFKRLYYLNRDIFSKLQEVEENNGSGFTFVFERGRRVSLRDLEGQIREEERSQSRKKPSQA